MNSIAFRLDADTSIGSGHLMRCLSIANEINRHGFQCHFLCKELSKSLYCNIVNQGHSVQAISNEENALYVLSKLEPTWLIIDHYNLDARFEKRARVHCQKVFVIDDLANRYHYCDILLDHGPQKTTEDYLKWVNKECKLYLGSDYAILGSDFRQYRKRDINKWEKGLICFGGADFNNIALKVLKELKNQPLMRDIKWTVLTGIVNPHWDDIKLFAEQSKLDISLIKHSDKVAQLLSEHDFAIGAAGGMTWERVCIGIPSLAIPIADNQSFSIEVIKHYGLGETLDIENITTETLMSCLKQLKENSNVFLQRSQSLVDGLGIRRLIDILLKSKFN